MREKIIVFAKKHRKTILILLTLAVVLPEVAVYFFRPGRGADIYGYIMAGYDALSLKNLYDVTLPGRHNTWPPFFSFFCVPLALSDKYLGLAMTKELWYFINFFCLILLLKIWILLIAGEKPKYISDDKLDFTSDIVFVPLIAILPAVINSFFWLQINPLVLFLISYGYYFYQKDKLLSAGTLFALAASIKAFPGLILIYFLIRKEWKVVGWMALMGVLFTISPVIFYGYDQFLTLLNTWLAKSFDQTFEVGHYHENQSLYAMWERYLVYYSHITLPGSILIHTLTRLSILTLFLASIFVFTRTKYDKKSTYALLEFSSICILMIIFSPIGWRHYFMFLFPAGAAAYIFLKKNSFLYEQKSIKYLMIAWIALLVIPYLSGRTLGYYFRTVNNWTWAAICLNTLILILLSKIRANINLAVPIGFHKKGKL